MAVKTGLVQGRFYPCPKRPNSVSSMADQADSHYIPPINYAPLSPQQVLAALKAILVDTPKEKVQWHTEQDNYLHLTFQTPLLKFRDDVEFYLPDDVSLIHMRSASRVGYSDWGTNRKRLERVRAALQEQIIALSPVLDNH